MQHGSTFNPRHRAQTSDIVGKTKSNILALIQASRTLTARGEDMQLSRARLLFSWKREEMM
jgi:hypothetical protein